MSVSNTSGIIYQCTEVAQVNQVALTAYFKSFGGFSNYMLAFIMNLVQWSPTLIAISNNINSDSSNCDLTGMYYQIGRITKILLSPQPIATASLKDQKKLKDFVTESQRSKIRVFNSKIKSRL